MKTIKVFIASSNELREERLEFSELFEHLNRVFKCRGIELEISKWELLDESMGPLRKQEEYNREIKTCDMCLVLYWTKIGDYTREELDVAYNELRAGRKPYKLYIYFKEVGEIGKDVMEFKADFEKHYGHFYCKYENIDTLKLRFLLQFENYQNSGLIKVENSQVKTDGIAMVNLDNVPFATNNERYRELKQRMAKLCEEISSFETVLKAAPNEVIEKMLNDKRSEYHELSEELSTYEQALFDTALRMAQYTGQRVSERMQRAMALFEEGKVSEANAVLDEAERDARMILAAGRQVRANAALSVDELLVNVSIMLADAAIPVEERIGRAGGMYSTALELCRECGLEKGKLSKVLLEYYGYLYRYARYAEAESAARERLGLDEALFGECSAEAAACYKDIGMACYKLGNYHVAMENCCKAAHIRKELLGDRHPDVAAVYNDIGGIYYRLEQYTQASGYYQQALEIFLENFDECHPDVARGYNNAGLVCSCLSHNDLALENYVKALEISLKVFGEQHLNVAMSQNNVALTYYTLGNYPKAMEYYEKALAFYLDNLGKWHPNVAMCYNNIGSVYYAQGEHLSALDYYCKALDIRRRVLGENHADVAASYSNLAMVYGSNGNLPLALENYRKALGAYSAAFGPSHPNVSMSYCRMAWVHNKMGDSAAALECYEKALEIRLSACGERDLDVAAIYEFMLVIYKDMGDADKAMECLRKGAEAGSERCFEYMQAMGLL